jgi:hypothetical protein
MYAYTFTYPHIPVYSTNTPVFIYKDTYIDIFVYIYIYIYIYVYIYIHKIKRVYFKL